MRGLFLILLLLLPTAVLAESKGIVVSTLESSLSAPGRTVSIDGFSGALSSQAAIDQLTVADDDGIWLTLKGVKLDWSRAALLSGRVDVTALTADEIILARNPKQAPAQAPAAEAAGFSLPELPVSIHIGKITAKRVEIGQPVMGVAAVFSIDGKMDLAGGEGTAELAIERTDGQRGSFTLDASYDNKSRNLALNLQADEAAKGILSTLIGLPGAPALTLSIKGTGPIDDYKADIQLATDGKDRLTGAVTLTTDKAQPGDTTPQPRRFTARIGGDIAPLFAPQYRDFFGSDIRLAVEGAMLPTGETDLSTLHLAAKGMNIDGQVNIGGDGLPLLLDLTAKIGTPGGPAVLLPVSGASTEITSADLTMSFDASKGNGWQGKLALTGLKTQSLAAQSLTLDGKGTIARAGPSGGKVDGTVSFDGAGLLPTDPKLAEALGDAATGRVSFAWAKGQPLSLPAIQIDAAAYHLTAGVTLDGLTLSGKATATIDDLSRLSALAERPLGGRVSLSVDGTAGLLAGTFDATAKATGQNLQGGQPQLDALMKGASTVTLSAKRDDTGTHIRDLTIEAATFQTKASGLLRTGASDLSADLSFSDLSALGAPYSGALTGTAHYLEADGTGTLTASAKGQDVTIGQTQADALLRGQSQIDLTARRQGDAVTIDHLTVSAPVVQGSAQGVVKSGATDLTASLKLTDLGSLGKGFGGGFSGQVHYTDTAGTAHVTANADANNLSMGQPQVDALLRGQTKLSLDATRAGNKIDIATFDLSNPQLTAKASGALNGTQGKIDLSARLANLALVAPGFPGPLTVEGSLSPGATDYGVDIKAQGPGALQATVAGSVAQDFKTADLALKGGVESAIVNAMIEPRSVRGPVRFDLRVKGAPALAAVSGTVNLGPARMVAPTLGISADPVTATVTMSGGKAQVQAKAVVGGGTVLAQGPVNLTAPFDANLQLTLARVLFKNPDLFSTHVSGRIAVAGPLAGGATISGRLGLGATEIQVPSTSLGGSSAIPELTFVGEPADVRATRDRAGLLAKPGATSAGGQSRPYPIDLTISAPNQVFIRGRGLDAELGGTVKLGGTSANVIPSGGFNLLRGRLDILGKRFALSEASLQLEGQFIPYVQIAASTVNDGITSTIKISGQATDPQVTFSSSPQLPQEEVLSQLLFGHGLASISAFQAAQLASAVATLAGKGGDGLVNKLRKSFGLDNFDVSSDATGATTVKAGKYLSKRLYTEVGVASDGTSEIDLNLDVTKSVTLKGKATSDGSTGVGVYYERDY